MTTQVISLGNNPFATNIWQGAVLLDAVFQSGTDPIYLRSIENVGSNIRVRTSVSATAAPTDAGPDLSDAWETYEAAFTFSDADGSTLVMKGPGHPDNPFADPTEPYFWIPDNATAWNTWAPASHTAATLTLDDGVAIVGADRDIAAEVSNGTSSYAAALDIVAAGTVGINTIPQQENEVVRMLIVSGEAGSGATWYDRFEGANTGSLTAGSDNTIVTDPTPGETTTDVPLTIDTVRWLDDANGRFRFRRDPRNTPADVGFNDWVTGTDSSAVLQLPYTFAEGTPGFDKAIYIAIGNHVLEAPIADTFFNAFVHYFHISITDSVDVATLNAVAVGENINLVIADRSNLPSRRDLAAELGSGISSIAVALDISSVPAVDRDITADIDNGVSSYEVAVDKQLAAVRDIAAEVDNGTSSYAAAVDLLEFSGVAINTIPQTDNEVVRMLITVDAAGLANGTWYDRFGGANLGSISTDSDNIIVADPTLGEEVTDVALNIDTVRWTDDSNHRMRFRRDPANTPANVGFNDWLTGTDSSSILQLPYTFPDGSPGMEKSVYIAIANDILEVPIADNFFNAFTHYWHISFGDAADRVILSSLVAGDTVNLVIADRSDLPARLDIAAELGSGVSSYAVALDLPILRDLVLELGSGVSSYAVALDLPTLRNIAASITYGISSYAVALDVMVRPVTYRELAAQLDSGISSYAVSLELVAPSSHFLELPLRSTTPLVRLRPYNAVVSDSVTLRLAADGWYTPLLVEDSLYRSSSSRQTPTPSRAGNILIQGCQKFFSWQMVINFSTAAELKMLSAIYRRKQILLEDNTPGGTHGQTVETVSLGPGNTIIRDWESGFDFEKRYWLTNKTNDHRFVVRWTNEWEVHFDSSARRSGHIPVMLVETRELATDFTVPDQSAGWYAHDSVYQAHDSGFLGGE